MWNPYLDSLFISLHKNFITKRGRVTKYDTREVHLKIYIYICTINITAKITIEQILNYS